MGIDHGKSIEGVSSAASFAAAPARSLPVMPGRPGVHPIWATEPERDRVIIMLQMSRRRGARCEQPRREMILMVSWLSMPRLTTLEKEGGLCHAGPGVCSLRHIGARSWQRAVCNQFIPEEGRW